MRLLILGAGAIGGYFGGRLTESGVDVTFLVRPNRAELLAREGLRIKSELGNLHCQVRTAVGADGRYDAVLMACKAYDLALAIDAVAPAIGQSTLVLPLLNGLRHLDMLDARFGADKVLGGLCHIGVTLGAQGEIIHLNRLQHFALGPRSAVQETAAQALHKTLARGGFQPLYAPSITQAMWEKFVLLATYAGMTCLMRANIGQIASTAYGEQLMNQALLECTDVASAAGFPPRKEFLTETRAMLTERNSTNTSSMLRDVRQGARTEHEHVLGDMLVRGSALAIDTPLIRVAHAHLQAYEAGRA